MFVKNVGKKVLIRTYSAGVFFGTLSDVSENGKSVELKIATRVWRWSGAASLSQMSQEGVSNPSGCKFAVPVEEVQITEVIEIIPLTETAIANLENVPTWRV